MGHQYKTTNNNRGGDSPTKGFYLSPFTRTISIGIIDFFSKARANTFFTALPYMVGTFAVAFMASCLTASIITPVQNSDATTQVNLYSSPSSYFVNISSASGGSIMKSVNPTTAGTHGAVVDTLTVNSNNPNGYHVYLSMYSGANNQYLVNTSDSTYHINPVSGSLANPGVLNMENTWGVAVSSAYNSVFDASYETVSGSSKFAPVPAYGNEELLFSKSAPASFDTSYSITVPVYYGYYVTSALPSGIYSNTVLYTAYAEAAANGTGEASCVGNNVTYEGGQSITCVTSLYTNRTISTNEVAITVGDETVPASDITSIERVASDGTNDSIRITFTAPAQSKPGTYTIAISIPNYAHTSSDSIFYDTPGIVIASGTYAGTYKNMQDMTTNICDAWDDVEDSANYDTANHRPYAFTNQNTPSHPVYDYGKTSGGVTITESMIVDSPDTYWSYASGGAISNINTDVPETFLQDNRDGNWYRIRKLPDGNCWMTENLRLVFYGDETNENDPNKRGIVGIVQDDGTIAPTNPIVTINESNSAVGASASTNASAVSKWTSGGETFTTAIDGFSSFRQSIAYTETDETKTIWGAESNNRHSSSETTTGTAPRYSSVSMEYARSYHVSSNHTVTDGDGEEQIIGTLYNYKTATAGTATEAITGGVQYADSICPKGWQLQSYIDTSKTWFYSTVTSYGGKYNSVSNPYGVSYGETSGNASVEKYHKFASLNSYLTKKPYSLIRSGVFRYNRGAFEDVDVSGFWWEDYAMLDGYNVYADEYSVVANYTRLNYGDQQGWGLSVRCVSQ